MLLPNDGSFKWAETRMIKNSINMRRLLWLTVLSLHIFYIYIYIYIIITTVYGAYKHLLHFPSWFGLEMKMGKILTENLNTCQFLSGKRISGLQAGNNIRGNACCLRSARMKGYYTFPTSHSGASLHNDINEIF